MDEVQIRTIYYINAIDITYNTRKKLKNMLVKED